jgi:Ca2+-binding EF-hand superfamily protein
MSRNLLVAVSALLCSLVFLSPSPAQGLRPPPADDNSSAERRLEALQKQVEALTKELEGLRKGVGSMIDAAVMAEAAFRQMDLNGDGMLSYDEMSDTLKAERDKWDTNKDGLIDLNEFKAYFKERLKQQMAGDPNNPQNPVEDEGEKKPTIYSASNLPQNIPVWFRECDTNKDGQVALYEWRAAGKSIEEFQTYDRNGDGFITIDEAMRFAVAMNNGRGGPQGSASAFGQGAAGQGGFPGAGQGGGNGRGRGGNQGGGFPGAGQGGFPGAGQGGGNGRGRGGNQGGGAGQAPGGGNGRGRGGNQGGGFPGAGGTTPDASGGTTTPGGGNGRGRGGNQGGFPNNNQGGGTVPGGFPQGYDPNFDQ